MEQNEGKEKLAGVNAEEAARCMKLFTCKNCGYAPWDFCFLYLFRKLLGVKKENKS